MRRVPHSYRCRSFSTVASSAVCVHQDGINSSIRECVEGQFVLARRSVCIERRPLEVFRSLDGPQPGEWQGRGDAHQPISGFRASWRPGIAAALLLDNMVRTASSSRSDHTGKEKAMLRSTGIVAAAVAATSVFPSTEFHGAAGTDVDGMAAEANRRSSRRRNWSGPCRR
jgi:hypothetical protein